MLYINDLNNEGCSLNVMQDNQGDVYVTIRTALRDYTVRIGGPSSGQCALPPKMKQALHELAYQFERYSDCENEMEAARHIIEREDLVWVNGQISMTKALIEAQESPLMKVAYENRLKSLERRKQELIEESNKL